jgi:uncharacterized membrane protein
MFLLILIALAAAVMAIMALNKISVLDSKFRKTRALVDQLQSELSALKEPGVAVPETVTIASSVDSPAPDTVEPLVQSVETSPPLEITTETIKETPPPKPSPLKGLEHMLAGRWFVVLGGIAIALGGLLFVKYAHDNGLIPPWLRVIFGYAFAAALVAGGEYVRRSRGEAINDYVPASLSAAGLVIAFGVTYAAYALYGLLSPGLCFPLLVAIGLGALWLSRRQGPVIAGLGLIGSYAAPALVPSDHPSAWGFFSYLIVIVAVSLYELRIRAWWWLGFAAIGGAFVWAQLWLNGGLFDKGQVIPVSLFSYALTLAAAFIPRGIGMLRDDMGTLAQPATATPPLYIAAAGLGAGALTLGSSVVNSAYSTVALLFFVVGMVAVATFGWLKPHRNIAAGMAALFTLLVFMAWPNVSTLVPAFDERGFWVLVQQIVEPNRFVPWTLLAGAAFTALGLLGTVWKNPVRYWDSLTAASPVLFLFGTWSKADFVYGDQTWATIAGVTVAILAFIARRLRSVSEDDRTVQTTDLLLGAVALLALFAADRLFNDIWYTLAISGLAAAFAFSSSRFGSRAPAIIVLALATFASIRLFVGREVWGEPTGLPLGAHWPLYGYGVPAALFWWSSRQLQEQRDNRYRVSLEGLSLGLLISMVSAEIRVLIGGGITADRFSLLELASHVTAWLGAAFGLAYRQKIYSGFISRWGAIALVGASCFVLLGLLSAWNPVISGDALEGGAIFNTLWLAYLAPAVLLGMIINRHDVLAKSPLREMLGVLAMVSVITFATLMVKRLYQGPIMSLEFSGDAESYTVSLVWLAMGVLGFVSGLTLDRRTLRLAGLVMLALTVLKTFVYDFAELTGLWRIASFMGLGFCLVGIGWLYSRFSSRKDTAVEKLPAPISPLINRDPA